MKDWKVAINHDQIYTNDARNTAMQLYAIYTSVFGSDATRQTC